MHDGSTLDDATSLVVEVASNDGYLLREFRELGVPVLGVEPRPTSRTSRGPRACRRVTAFFGRETARAVLAEHGHPPLIAANNVHGARPRPG